jgi:hypothetical protein
MVWVLLLLSRDTTSIFDDANSGVPKQQVPAAGTVVSLCLSTIWSSVYSNLTLLLPLIVTFDESINLLVNLFKLLMDALLISQYTPAATYYVSHTMSRIVALF